jgi:hypothetical protein
MAQAPGTNSRLFEKKGGLRMDAWTIQRCSPDPPEECEFQPRTKWLEAANPELFYAPS